MTFSGSTVFPDHGKQNIPIQWLLDGTDCSNPFLRIRKGAQNHNGKLGISTTTLQRLSKLPTVHNWHHQVEENQTWSRNLRKDLHCFLTVRSCVNAVSFPFKRIFDDRADIHLVLNQQNVFGCVYAARCEAHFTSLLNFTPRYGKHAYGHNFCLLRDTAPRRGGESSSVSGDA